MPADRRRGSAVLALTLAQAAALGAAPAPVVAPAVAPATVPAADAALLEFIAEFSDGDGFVDPLSLDARVNRDASRALDQQVKKQTRAAAPTRDAPTDPKPAPATPPAQEKRP